MESITNLLEIIGVNTDKIRDLIVLDTLTNNNIDEIENILNIFINYKTFLKQ